jgi:hypothetical protein
MDSHLNTVNNGPLPGERVRRRCEEGMALLSRDRAEGQGGLRTAAALDEQRQLIPDSVQAEPSLWSFYICGRSPPWTAEA